MKRWLERMLFRHRAEGPDSVLSAADRLAFETARAKLGPRLSRADEALRRALDDADRILVPWSGPERRRRPR